VHLCTRREDDEEEVEFQLKWQLAEVDDEDEPDEGDTEVSPG
jgi:hypothetical protein